MRGIWPYVAVMCATALAVPAYGQGLPDVAGFLQGTGINQGPTVDIKDTMNFVDCVDKKVSACVAVCKAGVPYPSPGIKYVYNEPAVLAEVSCRYGDSPLLRKSPTAKLVTGALFGSIKPPSESKCYVQQAKLGNSKNAQTQWYFNTHVFGTTLGSRFEAASANSKKMKAAAEGLICDFLTNPAVKAAWGAFSPSSASDGGWTTTVTPATTDTLSKLGNVYQENSTAMNAAMSLAGGDAMGAAMSGMQSAFPSMSEVFNSPLQSAASAAGIDFSSFSSSMSNVFGGPGTAGGGSQSVGDWETTVTPATEGTQATGAAAAPAGDETGVSSSMFGSVQSMKDTLMKPINTFDAATRRGDPRQLLAAKVAGQYMPFGLVPLFISEQTTGWAVDPTIMGNLTAQTVNMAMLSGGSLASMACTGKSLFEDAAGAIPGASNLLSLDELTAGISNSACVGFWGNKTPVTGWHPHKFRPVAAAMIGYRGYEEALKLPGSGKYKNTKGTLKFNLDYPFINDGIASPFIKTAAGSGASSGHKGSGCYNIGTADPRWYTKGETFLTDPTEMLSDLVGDSVAAATGANVTTDNGDYVFTFWKNTACCMPVLCPQQTKKLY